MELWVRSYFLKSVDLSCKDILLLPPAIANFKSFLLSQELNILMIWYPLKVSFTEI